LDETAVCEVKVAFCGEGGLTGVADDYRGAFCSSRRIISEVDIVSTETCISVTVAGGLRLTLKLVMCSNSTSQNLWKGSWTFFAP
jgi:hypothetical protein